ncbi:MAG TPA: glycosyltransferase family 4 protein [Candidatus Binataceae bacterium]|nr:glycosyltransferase family 4 protein [Candidatus Binataceae bacterium]
MNPYLLVAGDFVKTGGMDGANHALASYLADAGGEVHLAALRAEQDLARRPNVIVHRAPNLAHSYLLAEPLLDRAARRVANDITRRGGRVVVNGGNCQWGDVNWVHYVHAAYQPETERLGFRRLKCWMSRRRFVRAEATALRRARLVIANSERTRHDLVERLRVPESRVHRVYYGIDADCFRPVSNEDRARARAAMGWPENRPCVAFVGSLGDRRKGFDILFYCWRILCADRQWDTDLVVVGNGRDLPAWKARACETGLQSRIRFLGFRRDVPEILAACDALVAPARYEAYGRAVQEALCRGLPAFVSRAAGVAEHYPAQLRNLLLTNPENADDLAARLRMWRYCIDGYREAVAPLSQKLRAHTWNRMAAEIVDAVETAA